MTHQHLHPELRADPVVEARGLVKMFHVGDGEPVRAVDGLSIRIFPGEFVALYGPSGSGKSTLLDLLAGLQAPDAGSVILRGRDVSRLGEREHASCLLYDLGIVGHVDDLLPGATALENASLKLWRAGRRDACSQAARLLAGLGLGDRAQHQTRRLSTGERQRVSIAQALSLDPPLVLADEPTANLDTARGQEVLELLAGRCRERGAALLLATHDLRAAGLADRVCAMVDGRVEERRDGAVEAAPLADA